jgi:hypothetical protein
MSGLDELFNNKLTVVDNLFVKLAKRHDEARRPDPLIGPPTKKPKSTPTAEGHGRIHPPSSAPNNKLTKAPPPARLDLGDAYRVTPEAYWLDGVT